MPFNITIDHETTRHNSDRSSSSVTDEDSSDTGVHLSPHSDNYDYPDPEEHDGSWTNVLHPDEIRPSDSASRPRTSNRQRPLVEAPQPEDARRPSYRRRITHERIRNVPPPRSHHSPPSTEPESVDAHDEWQGDARGLQHGRQYAPYPPTGYPPAQYQTFPAHSVVPAGHHQQVVPFGFPGYQIPPGGAGPGYFAHQHAMPPHVGAPYSPPGGYYPYAPQGFPMPPAMPPQTMYHPYPVYSPPPVVNTPPPPSDTSKDDQKFERLEKLILDQKEEQAAKEAAAEKAAAEKAAKAEAEAEKAKEIKTASDKAAKEAKEKADKEHKAAAEKAAKEAEQAAKDAEKAAADAAAAKPPPPPAEKKKPIKFKDAVGRKFSFPFHLCCTWSGMEYLIKEAFTHVEVIGPHVEQGHYDLLGPQGEIILPHVWETVVEPDWTITMHMWPMNEEKEGDALVDDLGGIELVEGLPPPPPPAPSAPGGAGGDEKKPKKKKEKPPSLFGGWPGGKGKTGKSTKAKKKP